MESEFKIADGAQESWSNQWEINQDTYGRGVLTFAERWAILM